MIKKIANSHILMSGFYKGLSGLSLFLSIPILINYLGNDNYGIWVLVFTLFQWVLLMDFGVQSSLKTKIPVLQHENKINVLKSYIKTTYRFSFYIAAAIFVLFVLFVIFFNLNYYLNISFHSRNFVSLLFLMNIFFFCLNFVANIHKSLYVSFLKGKYAEESLAVNQFGFLVLLLIAVFLFPTIAVTTKLLLITVLNGVFCLIVNLFYTWRFFKMEQLNLYTNEKTPITFIHEIVKMGSKFMIIQLGMMFIITADNYIISNAFRPKDVVPYEVVNKIFQLPIMIIFAMLSPLWSMFANDYLHENRGRLLVTFKKFNYLFIGISSGVALLAILSPYIISTWINQPLEIPRHLILLVAVVTLFRIFISFYTFFLNGVGNLNKYMLLLLASVFLKIPLSYWLIGMNFGVNSVIISTLILMLFWMVLIPYQCYDLVYKLKKNE